MEYSADFEAKLKYARTYLLLYNPFFGTLVMNVQCIETTGPGSTAWTDGKNAKFNSEYVKSISREEFIAVLLHQILHTALQHKNRGKNAENKPAWNKACDEVVNQIVQANCGNVSSKIRIPDYMKSDHRFKELSAEQAYEILKKEISPDSMLGGGGNNNLNNDLYVESIAMSDFDYSELNNLIVRAENSAKMQGLTPLGIGREFDTLLHPKVDWRIMLKEFIQSFPNDWDFSNRDRRFLNSQFYMPSLNGNKIQIAIAIDTSGSISSKEITQFMTETYGILCAFDRVEILMMCCDAEVHGIQKVTSLQDATNFKVKGGGGTNFCPVFKELEENITEFNALIFFTDGFGTFPQDFYSNYKVLWIMTSDVIAPFGKTIKY